MVSGEVDMLKKRKDGKYNTGRPTVMTEPVLQKLEQAFSLDCSDEEACLHAGISPSTLYNYQNEHKEFLERKNLLKKTLVLKARTVIAEALNKNDRCTASWYLERKMKSEFSTREELTGIDGNPLSPTLQIEFVNVNGSKD